MAKDPIIGYDYFVGMHFVICHGPVDSLLRIRVDDKDAWLGKQEGGTIHINEPNLFGGKSREGGVYGDVDFEPGDLLQNKNNYLVSKIGDMVPAYRGVASAVLKQVCIGMNPYLKPWSFMVKRIHIRKDGDAQWYDAKSEIGSLTLWNKRQIIMFVLDGSKAMAKDCIDYVKAEMSLTLDKINDIRKQSGVSVDILIFLSSVAGTGYTKTDRYDAQDADFQSLKNFINTSYVVSTWANGLNFEVAFDEAYRYWFYKGNWNNSDSTKSMFFITRGVPEPLSSVNDAISAAYNMIYRTNPNDTVDIYSINVENPDITHTERVDNTPTDAIPNISIGESLTSLIFFAAANQTGTMNPAHIIRECLTDPKWGMGYLDSDIDDVSFTYAADKLYDEQMGMSILWDAESSIEDFIKLVCKHIDATLFVDRHTGQFTLKLVRDDYDATTLLVLNPGNVTSIQDFTRPSFGDLVNSLTLTYHNLTTDGPATISVQDIALAQEQRVTINVSVTYEGFVNPEIASKVAQRDLRVLSTPLISCTVVANQDAVNLNIGSVFKLTWPDFDIANVIMRVTSVAFGDGKSNRIRIGCVQDAFSFPKTAFIATPPPLQPTTGLPPQAVTQRMVFEVPYLQLVQEHGQLQVDTILAPANSPDAGYAGMAAARPSGNEICAHMYTDAGIGYFTYRGKLDFCPSAILDTQIDRMTAGFSIKNVIDPMNIKVGTWMQINDELMSVQTINDLNITVKRAVLDTVPYDHAAGSLILFWDTISDKDETQYVMSDVVDVKIASVANSGIELPLTSAPTDTLTISARAIRPYPPADVKVNGLYFPTAPQNAIVLTWASRNRLQQTGQVLLGFTDPSVTPELNTLYTVRVYDHNNALLHEVLNVNALTYTVPTTIVQNMGGSGVVSVGSVRDGWYSIWLHNIPLTININTPPASGSNTLDFVLDNSGTNTLDFEMTREP